MKVEEENRYDTSIGLKRIILVDIILILLVSIASLTRIISFCLGIGIFPFVVVWIALGLILICGEKLFPNLYSRRLKVMRTGEHQLIVFCISVFLMIVVYLMGLFGQLGNVPSFIDNKKMWIISLLLTIVSEGMVFWSGMLRIFFTSEQLAVKWRVIAVLCGLIPIANLIVLAKMMIIVDDEIEFENNRLKVNINRKSRKICETKYPILMVHGIFFRDFEYLNYWGRIPKALEENGARIFYGEHQSSQSVEKCGEELAARIQEICQKEKCDKVNIIAHSKGGLDSRYAISSLGVGDKVASLTTINTPHRGCEFAEYLLNKIPKKQQEMIAAQYNAAFSKLGDKEPDFIEGVSDLTFSSLEKFNKENPDVEGIYYQSVGSKQIHARSGRFPLNMSYHLVKYFDGPNDGLVGEKSFKWGEDYTFLVPNGKRGISHGDMIDLNRENIEGFDVREFYIQLVSKLREKGL